MKHRTATAARFLLLSLIILGAGGCAATGPGGTAWRLPTWEQAGRAAVRAAASPATWAPAAGAAVLSIGSVDRDVSRWSRENTPLFGSAGGARRASDILAGTTAAAGAVSALAPYGDLPHSRMHHALTTAGAVAVAAGGAEVVKAGVTRRRPDGSGTDSFPSLHAAFAAGSATAASINIHALPISDTAKTVGDSGLALLVAATGWARIEAGKHYPSDVLAGIAIGDFLGRFMMEAFLPAPEHAVAPLAEVGRDRIAIGISGSF